MPPSPVYVRCHCGLGNQLYQYAAATELARRRGGQLLVIGGDSLQLLVDAIGSEHVTTTRRLADPRVPAVLAPSRPGWAANQTIARLAGRLTTTIFQDPGQHYDPQPPGIERLLATERPVLLDGYFQHPTYLGRSVDTVAQLLLSRRAASSRRAGVIGVHVRRGDYLGLGWELGQAYYERALSLVDPDRRCRVLITSDDVLAARWLGFRFSELGWTSPVISSQMNSPADDLLELAMCQHFVGSNSTFSAWAAFVGDRLWRGDPRIVAVPDPWLPPTDLPPPLVPNWLSVPRNVPGDE